MTTPYFTPPAGPDLRPSYAPPAPSSGDVLQKSAGDLASVLMALRKLTQEGQLANQQNTTQNRELDVRKQLGLGEIDAKNAATGQDYAKLEQQIAEWSRQQQLTGQQGSALAPFLNQAGVQTQGLDPSALPGLVPNLEKMGTVGPLTEQQRNLGAYLPTIGTQNQAVAKEFLGPRPGVTVNNNLGANAYTQERGKTLATGDVSALDAASKGINQIAANINASNLVDTSFTGPGARAKLQAARIVQALGIPVAKDETINTQELIRYAQGGTIALLGSRALGSGTAVSDADRQYMQSIAGEDITRDPQALKKIFRINSGAQIMQAEETINQLRQRAREQPQDAGSLNTDAQTLENRLKPQLKRYADKLLQEEGGGTQRVKDFLESVRTLPFASDLKWVEPYLQRADKQAKTQDTDLDKILQGQPRRP